MEYLWGGQAPGFYMFKGYGPVVLMHFFLRWTPLGGSTGYYSGILSDTLSGSGILSGILFGILSDILSVILSGILPGGWGPAVPTGLARSPVEVQRCPLDSRDVRLRSSSAHWYREMVVWGPAAPTGIGSWQELAVEVQQCPLRSGAGEEARRGGAEKEGEEKRREVVESYVKILTTLTRQVGKLKE